MKSKKPIPLSAFVEGYGRMARYAKKSAQLDAAQAHMQAHIDALRDPKTGPVLLKAAIDATMDDAVSNIQKFGSGPSFFAGVADFAPPSDPVELTLWQLRALAGT